VYSSRLGISFSWFLDFQGPLLGRLGAFNDDILPLFTRSSPRKFGAPFSLSTFNAQLTLQSIFHWIVIAKKTSQDFRHLFSELKRVTVSLQGTPFRGWTSFFSPLYPSLVFVGLHFFPIFPFCSLVFSPPSLLTLAKEFAMARFPHDSLSGDRSFQSMLAVSPFLFPLNPAN